MTQVPGWHTLQARHYGRITPTPPTQWQLLLECMCMSEADAMELVRQRPLTKVALRLRAILLEDNFMEDHFVPEAVIDGLGLRKQHEANIDNPRNRGGRPAKPDAPKKKCKKRKKRDANYRRRTPEMARVAA